MEILGDQGWHPREANYVRTKKQTDPTYKKHCVRFSPAEDFDRFKSSRNVGDAWPEIIMHNSHDGTSSLSLAAGLYRLACSNGMTVKDEEFGEFRIRHDDTCLQFPNYLETALNNFGETVNNVRGKIDVLSEITVPPRMRHDMIVEAIELRGHSFMSDMGTHKTYLASCFDTPKRAKDDYDDMFTVINRIQEKIVRGGYEYIGGNGKLRLARAINSVDKIKSINEGVWNIQDKYTKELVGA